MSKVAIVKDGLDIGRIITGNSVDGSYDFKINFLENEYEVNVVKLFEKPKKHSFDNSSQWEMTYHRAFQGKPPIIHLKHKSKEQPKKFPKVDKIYDTLDMKRLLEPTVISDFPIPLMKIVVPTVSGAKYYKSNLKEHVLLDMNDVNVAEIYLIHTDFDFDIFEERWASLNFILMTHAIEYFATNDLAYTINKLKYFLPADDSVVRTVAISIKMTDEISLLINIYKDEAIENTNDKLEVTYIENEMYYALLGLTTITFPVGEGKVTEPQYGYEIDLERFEKYFAITEREKYIAIIEREKWRYRFNKWKERLERELRKRGL